MPFGRGWNAQSSQRGAVPGMESASTAALTLAELPPPSPTRRFFPIHSRWCPSASFARGADPHDSPQSTSGGAPAVLLSSRGH